MTVARKLLLPQLILTEVANGNDVDAVPVSLAIEPYSIRPMLVAGEGLRRDGKPTWVKHQFNLFPLVLDKEGVPWAEAAVYILCRLEDKVASNMATYAGIADDLAAYRRLPEHKFPVSESSYTCRVNI